MQPFFAKKNRGQFKDQYLYPHLHRDNTYVATNSKFSVDYVKVTSLDELTALVRAGYGARMSNLEIPQAPSFISHDNIIFSTQEDSLVSVKKILILFSQHDQLDGKTVANSRKEQAFLRTYLLRGQKFGACVICGSSFPAELLVAAHIKPRAECTQTEKLDFNKVAALMCVLGCDSLFEKGFVYVADGKICENPRRPRTPHLDAVITLFVGQDVSNWSSSSAYYDCHAKEFGWKE